MDGDLRYISLQYIKGDNYEEITCFKYEEIIELLDNKDDKLKIKLISDHKKLLNDLNKVKEEVNCKIGESFLNDLVNYYNFKDIRRILIDAKKSTEEISYNAKKTRNKDKPLIDQLEKIRTAISNLPEIKYTIKNKTKSYIADIIRLLIFFQTIKIDDNGDNDAEKNKKELLENFNEGVQKIIDDYQNVNPSSSIESTKNWALRKKEDNSGLQKYVKFKNEIIEFQEKYLLGLYDVLLGDSPTNLKKRNEEIFELKTLFNTYIKYCEINIGKYEKLFKYNEISNIDEAFMIESYSKFLKKLKKLKENLESKDTGKLKRLLVNSFNKLFNKYGIDPNKTLEQKDMAYISSLILQ